MLDANPNIFDATVPVREALTQVQQDPEVVIILKFVGPNCPACKTLAPVLDQLVNDHQGKTHLVTADMTEDPELAMEWGVRSIPTVMVLKGTSVVEKIVGLQPKKVYLEAIQKGLE